MLCGTAVTEQTDWRTSRLAQKKKHACPNKNDAWASILQSPCFSSCCCLPPSFFDTDAPCLMSGSRPEAAIFDDQHITAACQ